MTTRKSKLSLATLAVVTLVLAAGLAQAGEKRPEGMFLGINAGYGGSSSGYSVGSRSIYDEGPDGPVGSFRFGYAISSKFALSLEAFGFADASEDDDDEIGIGMGAITVTWHPVGEGFFVRTGFGGGGGNVRHPVTGEITNIRDRAAGLFGLGYDWRVGRKTSLGLSVDGMVIDAGGALGFDEDYVTSGGLTLQFTWHI